MAELQQQHPQGTVLQTSCDVSQIDDVQQLAAFAHQKLGRIDIWVNNAGVSQIPKASLADTAAEQIQQIVRTNMLGALLGSKVALQIMNAQPSGQTPMQCHQKDLSLSHLVQKQSMGAPCNVIHDRFTYLSVLPSLGMWVTNVILYAVDHAASSCICASF